MSQVKLSNTTVEIIDELTWGQREEIRSAMLSQSKMSARDQDLQIDGTALVAARKKSFEVCITKITDSEGTEIQYSEAWLNGLSVSDGDTLFEAIDKVTNPEKK